MNNSQPKDGTPWLLIVVNNSDESSMCRINYDNCSQRKYEPLYAFYRIVFSVDDDEPMWVVAVEGRISAQKQSCLPSISVCRLKTKGQLAWNKNSAIVISFENRYNFVFNVRPSN